MEERKKKAIGIIVNALLICLDMVVDTDKFPHKMIVGGIVHDFFFVFFPPLNTILRAKAPKFLELTSFICGTVFFCLLVVSFK